MQLNDCRSDHKGTHGDRDWRETLCHTSKKSCHMEESKLNVQVGFSNICVKTIHCMDICRKYSYHTFYIMENARDKE